MEMLIFELFAYFELLLFVGEGPGLTKRLLADDVSPKRANAERRA
jgi:hypothetical protein